MPADPWRLGAASLPLVFLLVVLLGLRWPGSRAGLAALALTVLLAVTAFGLPVRAAATAMGRAVALSVDVLYIIWTALALYQIAELTGAIRGIGEAIARLTEDHILQLLIIGFAFASFLQGVEGFGVPVAVTAPLLLGLGFRPLDAAAVPLVAHSWAVTLGTLATGFQALRAVTGLPARELAWSIAPLGAVTAFATGFAVMHLHAGWRPMRRAFGAIALMGATMGGVQLLLVWWGNWIIATSVAGMIGLVVGLQLARWTRRFGAGIGGLLPEWPPPEGRREPPRPPAPAVSSMSFHLAFLPYYVLLVLVGVVTFVPRLGSALSAVRITMQFPPATTSFGWITDAAQAALPIFGHPGALILYASVLSAVLFTRLGYRIPLGVLWRSTVRQGVPTSITILALVGVAMLMVYSGMTYLLAAGLARAGRVFPFLSPFIGVLGAVITGSNTNSNVLFGALQRDAAVLLRQNPVLIAALQTVGASLGSMITPAKVVLATVTTGLAGQEGAVMRVTGRYLLVMTALLGILGLGWSLF
ncbi:MAG TPA: L-lactate permease [bacterium]